MSTTNLWILAKIIAATPYILPCKRLTFGADRNQDDWGRMVQKFTIFTRAISQATQAALTSDIGGSKAEFEDHMVSAGAWGQNLWLAGEAPWRRTSEAERLLHFHNPRSRPICPEICFFSQNNTILSDVWGHDPHRPLHPPVTSESHCSFVAGFWNVVRFQWTLNSESGVWTNHWWGDWYDDNVALLVMADIWQYVACLSSESHARWRSQLSSLSGCALLSLCPRGRSSFSRLTSLTYLMFLVSTILLSLAVYKYYFLNT